MHVTKTQKLYNDAAHVDTGKDRNRGDAFPVKEYHNRVKRLLLETFALNAENLLDIATGRGGDLQKWQYANIKFVHGIDSSCDSLIEANRRLFEMKDKMPCKVIFEPVVDFAYRDFQSPHGPFSAISCMFALHYFFETEWTLHQTMVNVTNNLHPGGVFFGCVPHGLRLLEVLNGSNHYETTCLKISLPSNTTNCFGSAYDISITDTITEARSSEFLVFENVLTTVASMYGLYPIIEYPQALATVLFAQDSQNVFKHFDPQFSFAPKQQEVSRLFATFAFIKK